VALAGPFWRSKQARRSAPKPLESAAGDADVARRRVDRIPFSEALAAEGAVVFQKACELGLEGIVSKRQGSFYKNWLKTKNPNFERT
jgi:ATP-dependent DNA ligase